MQLNMLRSMWSGPAAPEALVRQTAAAGFDGIEGPIPPTPQARRYLKSLLADHGLCLVAEATTGLRESTAADWWVPAPDATPDHHLEDLRWTIDHLTEMDGLFVSTMCGYDAWSLTQNVDFFGRAVEIADAAGVVVSFETHRCRSLFNPWATRDVLDQVPAMKITCDFSHWCVVAERLIDSEIQIIRKVAEHAHHVHCRVGYAQHPQVADPRDPHAAPAVAAHERWWDLVWSAQERRGLATTTMTSEWGAEGYMMNLPYTQQPVANLWDITCWFAQRQRNRFAARNNGAAGTSFAAD